MMQIVSSLQDNVIFHRLNLLRGLFLFCPLNYVLKSKIALNLLSFLVNKMITAIAVLFFQIFHIPFFLLENVLFSSYNHL